MIRVGALMSALAFGAVAWADPPAAAPSSDQDKVQGYWKPLQCDYEGKAMMPTDIMKQVTVVFDKDQYHLYFKDSKLDKDGKPIIFRLALASIQFDPSTTPKSITFEFAEGPLKGKKSHGIYELAGNQLKMCYCTTDKPKPTKFESPANSGHFLETWARQVK
ncbi:hypothetical protein VT84_23095 [Gemmata sp. SH-PL17]|nr:hypothetical protein VT84_23095 [Gemmata sp. SH-PL17]